MAVYLILALKNPFPLMSVSSSGVKWSRKLFDDNSQVDGLGECSILDRTAIIHSHHSRRLFWPQSSLKKASHEKDPTGIHCHALSPTTCIIALCSGRSKNSEVRYAKMHQLWGWQADNFLSSASWLHSLWTNALNIDQYVFNLGWMGSHTNIGNSTFTLIVYVLSMFK